MENRTKKYSLIEYCFFALLLFTFGILSSKRILIDKGPCQYNLYVDTATVITIPFLILTIVYALKNKEKFKEFFVENKKIIGLLAIYILCNVVNAIRIRPMSVFYVIVKFIPFITLITSMFFLKNQPLKKINKYISFVCCIFIATFILSLIMYACGYTNAGLSAQTGIHFVTYSESMSLFGEKRLYWFFSHKSRFAAYCIVAMIFLLSNEKMNKKVRYFGTLLSFVCILLSCSVTLVVIYLLILLAIILRHLNFLDKVKKAKASFNKYDAKKKRNIYILIGVVIIAFIVLGIIALKIVGAKRDIWTLGKRTYVWEAAIGKFFEKPFGIANMPEGGWIKTKFFGDAFLYTNGHNVFLNEFIENGAIGGTLYFIIMFLLPIKYLKSKDYVFTIFLFLLFIIGFGMEAMNCNELPYIIFVAYALNYYKYIKNGDRSSYECSKK